MEPGAGAVSDRRVLLSVQFLSYVIVLVGHPRCDKITGGAEGVRLALGQFQLEGALRRPLCERLHVLRQNALVGV